MRPRLLPYKRGSRSARALSTAARVRRLNLVRTKPFNLWGNEVVINWGAGTKQFAEVFGGKEPNWIINHPEAVERASDKLASLKAFADSGVNHPLFTTSRDEAQEWVDAGRTCVVRHLTRGNSGRGIELIDSGRVSSAPLYTRYVPKFDEYRVHIWMGEVLDTQQKRRRITDNDTGYDNRIRNSASGWVFCRERLNIPDAVLAVSKAAVQALGLDFGAVDVGFTRNTERATVYEVNTAPGLEGTTLDRYARELRNIYRT